MAPTIEFDLHLAEMSFESSGGTLIRRSIHPSGVRVLSESVPGSLSATIGFWFSVGSRDEELVAFGSTHFLEHLLFKGTDSRSAFDIAAAFDEVGGEHNAMTSKEYTCYYATVQEKDLPMAVNVLADMVAASRLDEEDFELERKVILEELAMADDDPSEVAHERIAENVLAGHPLGRPIGGTSETIRSSTRDSVNEHYKSFYKPSDLVVAVAGAVNHQVLVDSVLTALAKAGWDLDNDSAPTARRSVDSVNLVPDSSYLEVSRPLEQSVVILGAPGLKVSDGHRDTMAILTAALGGGMSSRLFQEIRERRGLAYSVYSYANFYSDAGLFGMAAGTSPENLDLVSKLMTEALLGVAESGISNDELFRVKGNLGGASALALETNSAKMMRLGRAEILTGEFVDHQESLQRIDQVDCDQVTDLARNIAQFPLAKVVVGGVSKSP